MRAALRFIALVGVAIVVATATSVRNASSQPVRPIAETARPNKPAEPPPTPRAAVTMPGDVPPGHQAGSQVPAVAGQSPPGGAPKVDSKQPPIPLEEVVSRIKAAVAEQNARAPVERTPRPPSSPARRKAKSKPASVGTDQPQAPRAHDGAKPPAGITLTWDGQIDPRRPNGPDLGIRLVWPPWKADRDESQ